MKISPVMGVPVCFDPKMSGISETRGLGPWKKIVVGPQFSRIDARQQAAILVHEVGHIRLNHLAKRIGYALLNFWRPAAIWRYCRMQELQADAFVVGCGYGRDFALFCALMNQAESASHPSSAERISAIGENLRRTPTH